MSSAKPCLPGCPSVGEYIDSLRVYGKQPEKHLPACPNAEAPKVERGTTNQEQWEERERPHKPAHAPEPKQGSVEPIDWQRAEGVANSIMCERDHHYEGNVMLSRAYLALRAEVERLRPAAEKWFEECATAHLNPPYHVATLQTDLAAERAAREKAEARVRELEEQLRFVVVLNDMADAARKGESK